MGELINLNFFFISRVKKNHEDLRKEWCIHTIRTKTLKKKKKTFSTHMTQNISFLLFFSFLFQFIYTKHGKEKEKKKEKKNPPTAKPSYIKKSSHQFRLKSPPYHSPRALPHPDCQNFQPPLDSPAQLPRGPARIGNTASRP